MSTVISPHCHSEVPRGAKVCRGCQAEIEYGVPPALLLLVTLIADFLSWKTGMTTSAVFGWVVFATATAAGLGWYACARLLRNRINFKRVYRTRYGATFWQWSPDQAGPKL